MVGGQDVANEQQPYSLTFRLRGEEGSEEVLGYVGRYAASVVRDTDPPAPFRGSFYPYRLRLSFNTVLDNVDEYLLKEDGIQMNGNGLFCELEVQTNTRTGAQILQEGTAGFHLFAEVAKLKLRLRDLNNIGKAGDEFGKRQQTARLIF